MKRTPMIAAGLLACSALLSHASARVQTGIVIPQHGDGFQLSADLYAPDPLDWPAPYPLITMLPGGGAETGSVAWAAMRLADHGYMVVVTKPQFGGSVTSYNLAARSGIDFLLSPANPFLAEADGARVGACGWSLGARALTLTQEEDTRLRCIVAWDNLALSENGDAGSPGGTGTGIPLRTPRVPALGQAGEYGNVGADVKLTAFRHWRDHGIPCAQVVFNTGGGVQAHLKWGSSGTNTEHDRFHHYTRAWLDRWLKDDRQAVERLLVGELDGVAAGDFLSPGFKGGIFVDGYDSDDLRGLVFGWSARRVFTPAAADPAITSFNQVNVAFKNPSARSRGRLLVFLPGTGARPANYLEVLRCAGDRGFHALGLMYPNAEAVNDLTASSGPEVAGLIRAEILDGIDRTDLVNVDRTHSIENRLITALQHLASVAPTQGWDEFLENGKSIRWDSILIGGHSQGGGHAGFIATRHRCARALMFNAVDWNPQTARPADWMFDTPATPRSQIFGIGHLRDPLVPAPLVREGWHALGIDAFGDESVPESDAFPFALTHQFMTDIPSSPSGIQFFHGAAIADARMPFDPYGIPKLRAFWGHLLTTPGLAPRLEIDKTGTLRISTESGLRYQLQTSSDLKTWANEGQPFPGDGTPLTFPKSLDHEKGFYRVETRW